MLNGHVIACGGTLICINVSIQYIVMTCDKALFSFVMDSNKLTLYIHCLIPMHIFHFVSFFSVLDENIHN
jgi:hypothetical protein